MRMVRQVSLVYSIHKCLRFDHSQTSSRRLPLALARTLCARHHLAGVTDPILGWMQHIQINTFACKCIGVEYIMLFTQLMNPNISGQSLDLSKL